MTWRYTTKLTWWFIYHFETTKMTFLHLHLAQLPPIFILTKILTISLISNSHQLFILLHCPLRITALVLFFTETYWLFWWSCTTLLKNILFLFKWVPAERARAWINLSPSCPCVSQKVFEGLHMAQASIFFFAPSSCQVSQSCIVSVNNCSRLGGKNLNVQPLALNFLTFTGMNQMVGT